MGQISKKREAILSTASELFGQFGYQAVGVDTIIANAKVAKMTFYTHFKSKDELVECILLRRDADLREQVGAAIAAQKTPMRQLEAIFRWYENWYQQPSFYGCMFVKASNEYSDKKSRVRHASRQYQAWLMQTLSIILGELRVRRPVDVAVIIQIQLEGLTLKQSMADDFDAHACDVTWKYIRQLVTSQSPAEIKSA